MKRTTRALALLITVIMLFSAMPVFSFAQNTTFIVTLDEGVSPTGVISVLEKYTDCEAGYIYSEIFNGFSLTAREDALDLIASVPGVVSVREAERFTAKGMALDEEDEIDQATAEIAKVMGDLRASEDYRGEGMVAAVIDTGFNMDSEYFKLTDKESARLDKSAVEKAVKKSGTYLNEKLPFVYDYTDRDTNVTDIIMHGTGVAGILAANGVGCDIEYYGVAPEAQLVIMKVFDDDTSDSSEEIILAALEDALKLGADVINLSIGMRAGNDNGTPLCDGIEAVLDRIYQSGTLVVCSAGNEGEMGELSLYDTYFGIDTSYTAYPDIGTLSTPATVPSTLAAASIQSGIYPEVFFRLSDGTRIRYTDSAYSFSGKYFGVELDGKTLEYVCVDGLGAKEDYEGIDAKGKVALIKRGVISFAEKLTNAAENGAVAAIVYNNAYEEGYKVNMDMTGVEIPAVFIGLDDGLAMVEAKDKKITVNAFDYGVFDDGESGGISSFSSVGTTPELGLKPEISASGESIMVIDSDGEFSYQSGTSMSAPRVAGLALLTMQMLRETREGADHGKKLDSDAAYVKNLLMNSAKPMTDENGVEYSPRRQGAGVASLDRALDATIMMTGEDGYAKAELGDDLKNTLNIRLNLKNITDKKQTYKLSTSALIDGYVSYYVSEDGTITIEETQNAEQTPYFFTGSSIALEKAKISISSSKAEMNLNSDKFKEGAELTLNAGEEKQIFVKVTLSSSEMKKHEAAFENGYFVEGFIYAQTDDGAASSIPYMGFCGDWESLPIFDYLMSDESGYTLYEENLLYTDIDPNYFGTDHFLLGMNINATLEDEMISIYPERLAFSPNNDGNGDNLYMVFTLLRNAKDLTYYVKDSEGNIIYRGDSYDFVSKSCPAEQVIEAYNLPLWDGSDGKNTSFVYPDGEYTAVLEATPYAGKEKQTVTVDFNIDTKPARLESAELIQEDGKDILRVTVSDDGYLMYAFLYSKKYDFVTGEYGEINSTEDAERGGSYTADFDITGCEERYIYIDACDYAYNKTVLRVDLKKLGYGK